MRNSTWISAIAATALCSTATADGAPAYQAGRLVLPRVDTPEQVGMYQDAVLQAGPDGRLTVVDAQTLGEARVYNLTGMTEVEVRRTSGVPQAVFLRVSGVDPTCDYTGPLRVFQRREGSRFDVNLSAAHLRPYGQPQVCTAQIRNYRLTIPLEVYGLAAGVYSFSINGVLGGEFTLEQDNRFGDDCDPTRAGSCP